MDTSKPDQGTVPPPPTSVAENTVKDSSVPGQQPSALSTRISASSVPTSTSALPVSQAAAIAIISSVPTKETLTQDNTAKPTVQLKSVTGPPSLSNPSSVPKEQDKVVTTSAASLTANPLQPPTSTPATKSAITVPSTQAQVSVSGTSTVIPLTSIPDSRAGSTQNPGSAVKRSQPEADTTAPHPQQPQPPMDSDSGSVSMPKRKKIRKDKEPPKPSQPPQTVDAKDSVSSGMSGGSEQSDKSDTSASSAVNSGPKVPPIKIVLQPHAPANGGSGNNGQGTESDPANGNSHAHHHSANGSGFPYVVSSTTPETTTTTTPPSSVPVVKMDVTGGPQDKKESGPVNEKASDATVQQISKLTISGATVSQTLASSSGPVQGPTVSTADSVTIGEITRKDPVVKLDVMQNIPTSIAVSSAAAAAKEVTLVVTSASSSASTSSGNSGTPLPTSGASSSAPAEETPTPTSTSSSVPTPKEQTTTPSTSKEKPQRVTRSSQRIATNTGGVTSHIFPLITPNSPGGGSPKPSTSACPSPNHMEPMDVGPCANQKVDAVAEAAVELNSKKRRIKGANKEPSAPSSSSSSTSGEPSEGAQAAVSTVNPNDPPLQNCVEMFLNIRKQIERRRRNLFPVQPKPPQGFKDYLMNRGTYVLASNSNAQLAVPTHQPPPSLPPQCKDMFIEQEKERHKLRIQQVVEKEKLVLSVEQEILRVHGRAARALSNQALPFSVCTILKDQEVYNLLTPEQEEKDRNARSRYNGRLFLSWLQDVDDKWDKIKEAMLLRHHNEAESLHAVQKMDWEWKLKEVGLCEPKANPQIDEIHVPMVHVSDDFDLLPA